MERVKHEHHLLEHISRMSHLRFLSPQVVPRVAVSEETDHVLVTDDFKMPIDQQVRDAGHAVLVELQRCPVPWSASFLYP